MSCKGTSNTNKHLINILSILVEKIKYIEEKHKINNSIRNQFGLLQDIEDIILPINSDKNLFPHFYVQLKISPRKGWNGRGSQIG